VTERRKEENLEEGQKEASHKGWETENVEKKNLQRLQQKGGLGKVVLVLTAVIIGGGLWKT